MTSRLIDVAFFNSAKDNQPKTQRIDWDALCKNHMSVPTIVRGGQTREEAKKRLPAISFVMYEPGAKRSKEKVIWLDAVVFDIDQDKNAPASEHVTVNEFMNILTALKVEAWIYPTFSYTPECPKFRVVIPTAAPVLPEDWHRFVDAAVEHLGLNSPRILAALDLKATKDVARLWFLPAVWETI